MKYGVLTMDVKLKDGYARCGAVCRVLNEYDGKYDIDFASGDEASGIPDDCIAFPDFTCGCTCSTEKCVYCGGDNCILDDAPITTQKHLCLLYCSLTNIERIFL